MKEYMKYIISTIVFLVVYTLVSYLLTKNIDFKMIIITSIVYAISYITIDLVCNKISSKSKKIIEELKIKLNY